MANGRHVFFFFFFIFNGELNSKKIFLHERVLFRMRIYISYVRKSTIKTRKKEKEKERKSRELV